MHGTILVGLSSLCRASFPLLPFSEGAGLLPWPPFKSCLLRVWPWDFLLLPFSVGTWLLPRLSFGSYLWIADVLVPFFPCLEGEPPEHDLYIPHLSHCLGFWRRVLGDVELLDLFARPPSPVRVFLPSLPPGREVPSV